MRSPAWIFGWALWRQHRVGMTASAACLAALAVAARLVPVARLNPSSMQIAAFGPVGIILLYLVGVFTYSLGVDMAAPSSGFPAHTFTLPVRTRSLVFWPMAYGLLAVAAVWAVAVLFIFHPAGWDTPLGWPAALAAACLAWLQAIVWWPFALPQVRTWVAGAVLTVVIMVVVVAGALGVSRPLLFGVLVLLLLPAFPAAERGVARARRGDGRESPHWFGRLAPRRRRRRPPFRSAIRAQVWWEWRRHGLMYPSFLAFAALPYAVIMATAAEESPLPWAVLLGPLLWPLILAGSLGTGLGKHDPWAKDPRLPAFLATRPVTVGTVVGAKWLAAGLINLAGWGVVAPLLPLAIAFARRQPPVLAAWGEFTAAYPGPRAAVVLGVGAVLLFAATWKAMAETMWVSLTGRTWVAYTSIIVGFILFLVMAVAGALAASNMEAIMTRYPDLPAAARRAAAWAAAAGVALKLAVSAWAFRAVWRRRLLSPRAVAGLLAAWGAAVACIFLYAWWLIPPAYVPAPVIAAGAALLVPLAQLAFAPLALNWNRHR